MKVLFLLTNYPGFGGIEKVTSYLVSFLRKKSINTTILSFGSNAKELIDKESRDRLFFVPDKQNYTSKANLEYINNHLEESDYDVIVFQDSYAPVHYIFEKIAYPWFKKLIIVEHNTPLYAIKTVNSYFYFDKGFPFFLKRVLYYIPSVIKAYYASRKRRLFLLNNCKKYVLLSEIYKKDINCIVGRKFDDKIISITNPLTIQPGDNKTDFCKIKNKQILFVGRMTNQKGFSFLMKIWKEFSKINKDNWELVLLSAGADKEKLEQLINKQGLVNIRIDKPTTEIHRYYEESAILVMTSIYEGFPLVLAEAMSRGSVPIVFDSFKSVHDIIENGVNGIIVKAFGIKRYAKELGRLVEDKTLREMMAKDAIQTSKKFNIEAIGTKWIELFNEINMEQ